MPIPSPDDLGPGELFHLIWNLPHDEAIRRINKQAQDLFLASTTTDLDAALNQLAYTIHVVRERIFCEEREANLVRFANFESRSRPRVVTIDDLL